MYYLGMMIIVVSLGASTAQGPRKDGNLTTTPPTNSSSDLTSVPMPTNSTNGKSGYKVLLKKTYNGGRPCQLCLLVSDELEKYPTVTEEVCNKEKSLEPYANSCRYMIRYTIDYGMTLKDHCKNLCASYETARKLIQK